MKWIIAGSRDFDDYELLCAIADHIVWGGGTQVVSGMARGADTLGERWAAENAIPVQQFPAHWKEEGKAAGVFRNKKMADYADALLAFWDGESRGTKHMIDTALEKGLSPIVVIRI